MRIGRMLAWMFVTGTAILVWANAIGKAWPLFLLFPAFGLAIPVGLSGAGKEPAPAGEPEEA
jgi:Na+/glutamate symporter